MRIGVLGSGDVGGKIAKKLASLGHEVMLGSPHAKDKADEFPGIALGSASDAAQHGDWVVNAMEGAIALEALKDCAIDGKIFVDIGNFESSIEGPLETPLGEAIQAAHPKTRLVKTLNNISAHLMVDPGSLPQATTVFIASNDDEAKAEVKDLLKTFGWTDIVDLGDLKACRAMENMAAAWISIEKAVGGPNFNFSLVRR
ncbi:NAD(P)-binding domain-containing protein [Devosia sp. BK]|jgi:predicted dinucleotide-binding enzyme|uniref:NADPH-dependent F420 reductase n=2 Tax=unclassified Devosia TaxID=196773 RepID=UPI00071602C5|nr:MULTISPECIES: NAD(P)-binding domain-containing protein [unclassified Devosia]KQN76877.1 hypothetical protein ASE94_18285 [Devosia sp. Leaf64]MDV3251890.1 NAD(P)-binding domain-containing protein [Devosia sp. BK]